MLTGGQDQQAFVNMRRTPREVISLADDSDYAGYE